MLLNRNHRCHMKQRWLSGSMYGHCGGTEVFESRDRNEGNSIITLPLRKIIF